MRETLTRLAPAKLNLCLHVLRRRDDGYHALQTAYELLDYGDTVTVTLRPDGAIRRSAPVAGVAEDEDLSVAAARLLRDAAGVRAGADITIHKRIPPGSGLGGGSSDAAATLLALNRLWRLGWSRERLQELAPALGADVAVFVLGRSAWAEGIGERLTPIALPARQYVVVVPPVTASTARVFGALELTVENPPIRIPDFPAGEIGALPANDLEAVACALYPEIGQALRWLGRFAPARMSGSGSAVFAAVADEREGRTLLAGRPQGWSGFTARSLAAGGGDGAGYGAGDAAGGNGVSTGA